MHPAKRDYSNAFREGLLPSKNHALTNPPSKGLFERFIFFVPHQVECECHTFLCDNETQYAVLGLDPIHPTQLDLWD